MAFADQVPHGWMHGKVFTLTEDVQGERYLGYWNGNAPAMESVPLQAGTRVKVVSVSRFYDCGITPNLDAKNGYVARVSPIILKLADREETKEETDMREQAQELYLRQQKAWDEIQADLRKFHSPG